MADTFSTFSKVRLPQTGTYLDTWGPIIDADALNLLDMAISGWTVVDVGTGTAYALPEITLVP